MYRSLFHILVVFTLVLSFSANAMGSSASPQKAQTDPSLSLRSLIIKLTKNHEEIKNLSAQVEQAQAQYAQSKGLYYPTMDLVGDGGREKIDNEFTRDTTETRYSMTLRATQLITDFGKTNETIDRSGLFLDQKIAQLESTRQQLILDGITAYINIVKTRDRLKSAIQSESRIKELTGIEKTLVKKNAGLSSDVLQATSQLAGARALRVFAEGELNIAKNRFRAVFYRSITAAEIDQLEEIDFPHKHLPLELDKAIETALQKNPELIITRYNNRIAQGDVNIAKTAFYPRFNVFAEAVTKDNDAGVIGYSNEASAGLELKYNIFSGGSDNAALKAALASKKASSYRTGYVEKTIREQVNNSWDQLTTLRLRSDLLDEQAEIVKEFLELAKKERKMGTRSLLDVLTGEINYINAIATSISTRQDTKIAAFNLLFSIGNIGFGVFE